MTRYIHILQQPNGRHCYSMALIDEKGEVHTQHHFATEAETIQNVDFLLRMGFQIASTSEATYLQLMRHGEFQ